MVDKLHFCLILFVIKDEALTRSEKGSQYLLSIQHSFQQCYWKLQAVLWVPQTSQGLARVGSSSFWSFNKIFAFILYIHISFLHKIILTEMLLKLFLQNHQATEWSCLLEYLEYFPPFFESWLSYKMTRLMAH